MWLGLGTPRLCSWGEAKLWNWWNPTNQIERWEWPVLNTPGQRTWSWQVSPLCGMLGRCVLPWQCLLERQRTFRLSCFLWKLVWIRVQILCSHLVGPAASTVLRLWNTTGSLKCSARDGSTKRSVQTPLVLPCCLGWEEAHWGTGWLRGLVWSLEGEWEPVSLQSYW